jgi:hypothetical protein
MNSVSCRAPFLSRELQTRSCRAMLSCALLPPQTTRIPLLRTFSSARPQPRFRIPAHVAAFSVILTPAIIYFAFYERFGDEEKLQEELRARYADEIRVTSGKNQHMADFFRHTFRNPDGTSDDKLDELLRAGKKAKKRLHAVDESLYRTAEGTAEKQRTEQESVKQKQGKKKNPPGVRPSSSSTSQAATSTVGGPAHSSHGGGERESRAEDTTGASRFADMVDTKTVVSFASVAVLAAAAGYLFGGRSNRA